MGQAQVPRSRRVVFGIDRDNMIVGDKQWLRPLDHPTTSKWYFPSKFAFMSFHPSEYYQMQYDRMQSRPVHPAINRLDGAIDRWRRLKSEERTEIVQWANDWRS